MATNQWQIKWFIMMYDIHVTAFHTGIDSETHTLSASRDVKNAKMFTFEREVDLLITELREGASDLNIVKCEIIIKL